MTAALNRARRPGVEAAAAVAQHLDAFAATLSPRERPLLYAALAGMMTPLDRIKERDPAELLDEDERRELAELLAVAEGAPST